MKEYISAVNGAFRSCTNPEEALLAAIDIFIGYLISAEKNAVDLAANLIKIDEQERRERPDLDTRGHDAVPPPTPAVGANAWTDPNGWTPNPAHPAN